MTVQSMLGRGPHTRPLEAVSQHSDASLTSRPGHPRTFLSDGLAESTGMSRLETEITPVEPQAVVSAQAQLRSAQKRSWEVCARGKGRVKSRALQPGAEQVRRLTSLSQE